LLVQPAVTLTAYAVKTANSTAKFSGADPGIKQREGRMASAELKPVTGFGGGALNRGRASGQGIRGRSLLDFLRPKDGEKLVHFEGFLSCFQSDPME